MKFRIGPPVVASKGMSIDDDKTLGAYQKFMLQSARVGLYSLILVFVLWGWLVFPDFGIPKFDKTNLPLLVLAIVGYFFGPAVVAVFTHEFLHLIALPTRLWHRNTTAGVWLANPLWKSTFYVQTGGRLTRESFCWISVAPFVGLTLIPFVLAAISPIKPPLFVGLIACYNAALSATDLGQTWILFTKLSKGTVLRDE